VDNKGENCAFQSKSLREAKEGHSALHEIDWQTEQGHHPGFGQGDWTLEGLRQGKIVDRTLRACILGDLREPFKQTSSHGRRGEKN